MKYRVPVLETFGWQEPVKSTTINAAPNSPTKGDRYIVPKNVVPADIWDGHSDDIAWYDGTIWKFDTPEAGWSTFVESQLLAFTFNGTEWGVAEAGAVVTTELFVDNNRVDTYPENGSRSLPYKSVMDAINSVITKADNTYDKAYSIYLMPGMYDENVTFESSSLVNLTIKGSSRDSVIIRPSSGNSLQSNSNNNELRKLVIENVGLDAPIVMSGAVDNTNFGGFLGFDDVLLTENATVDISNALSFHILGDTYVHSDVIVSNIGMTAISNDAGFLENKSFTVKSLPGNNSPNGITEPKLYVFDNIIQRDIIWDLTGGGTIDAKVVSAVLGASEDNNVIIPDGVVLTAINSTLLGNYTYNGELRLRGSFVTGTLDPNSTGTLSMKVQSADMLSLGLPPDGALSDGLVDLSDDSTVVYAVDEFNEILKDLAPPQSDPLTGVNLDNNRSLVTGRIPNGLSASWMDAESLSPGDQINNVITQDSLVLASGEGSPNSWEPPGTVPVEPATTNSASFRKGDEGKLVAKHQIAAGAFDIVATLDIDANFKENPPGSSPPRPHVQDLSTWDAQGDGDPCTDAVVNFNNGKGTLQVTDVRWFNDFNKWQKMNAQLNISSLDPGYNKFSLLHQLASDEESSATEVYYANDSNGMLFSTEPTIVEASLTSSKYLSGVRYYSTGDTFTVNYAGDNVFSNVYHPSRCSMFRFEARASNDDRQPSTPPGVNDTYTINEVVAIDRTNYYDIDTRLSANFHHPYKPTISDQTVSENRLVNTYPNNRSTNLREYFTDENYRMEDGAFDSLPSSLTGNWDSTQVVGPGKAIVGGGSVPAVRAGNFDLSGTLPVGNPNYTGRSGTEVYVRGFKSANANSGCTIELQGLTGSDVGVVGSGNVNVEIKLPTQTGWLDLGKAFNSSQFSGVDGDGCQTAVSGDVWTVTFGTFSTANCDGTIMVRITFLNTSRAITGIIVGNF